MIEPEDLIDELQRLTLTCNRCKKDTGNNTQGHYWAYCKVTKTNREFHFCCPDDCELEEGCVR